MGKDFSDMAVDVISDDVLEIETRNLRIIEALLFASKEPIAPSDIAKFLSDSADIENLLGKLEEIYQARGINLVKRGSNYAFRTADDLSYLLLVEQVKTRPLTRASLETLSIIAYHQPVTRAEIEEVRGVATGSGTLDILMEANFIKMRGRRRTPGRPITYGTTEFFLDHFSLQSLGDLPGLEELKGAGLLSSKLPDSLQIPIPFSDMPFDGGLQEDEDPLDDEDEV